MTNQKRPMGCPIENGMNKESQTALITTSIFSTSMMTAYSYMVSKNAYETCKEPELLSKMLRSLIRANKHLSFAAGWLFHYSMGVIWIVFYRQLLKHRIIRQSVKDMIKIGTLSGVIAVCVWRAVFCLHPKPPKINYLRFYKHLVIAHILFALCGMDKSLRNFVLTK